MAKIFITPEGIPITVYNDCIQGDGFHVSYNPRSVDYGSPTTALVYNDNVFLVLNGNHLKNYAEILGQGFSACFDYFMDHLDRANKLSEHKLLDELTVESVKAFKFVWPWEK